MSKGVLIFAGLANRHRLHKLKMVDQFVMMYGGLRGAVAFALVLLIDKKVRHLYVFYLNGLLLYMRCKSE